MLKQTERSALLRKELAELIRAMTDFEQTIPSIEDVTEYERKGAFEEATLIGVDLAVKQAQSERLAESARRLAKQIAELESAEYITWAATARESL